MSTPIVNEYWTTVGLLRGKPAVKLLLPLISGLGYIGGSFAAWVCSPAVEPMIPSDVDIFATSDENAQAIIARLVERFNCGQESNPITTTLYPNNPKFTRTIQVVKPNPDWKTYPDDILNSFDFDVCRAVILNSEEVLADFNVGLFTAKILRLNNPLRSLKRVIKYAARGVNFPDWELIKLFLGWEAMPAERREEWVKGVQEEQAREARARQEFQESLSYDGDYSWLDDDEYFDGE